MDQTLGAMSGMLNALLDINQIETGTVHAEMTDFPSQWICWSSCAMNFRLSCAGQGALCFAWCRAALLWIRTRSAPAGADDP